MPNRSMRRQPRSIVTAALVAVFLALPARLTAAEEEEEHSPLHEAMEAMGETYKNLSRGMRRPDPAAKADYLQWLQAIQSAAVEAKQHVPPHVLALPAADQPAMITAFRSDLAAALETMLQLERAILADDWEKAQDLWDELRAQRRDGHKKYDPED